MDLAIGQFQRRQHRIGGVEHGDARAALGQQAQLIFDVARLRAVPVQMFGIDIERHRYVRPRPTQADVAGLVARQFDRPELRRLRRIQRVQGFQQRQADVAGQRGAVAAGAQQMRQQRSRGALALGAGDADGASAAALRGVFAEPQRGAADQARALFHRGQRFGAIRADAWRFDDPFEPAQALGAGRGFHYQSRIVQAARVGGLTEFADAISVKL